LAKTLEKWSRLFLNLDLTIKKGRLFIDKNMLSAWDDMTSVWGALQPKRDAWEMLKRGMAGGGKQADLQHTVEEERVKIPGYIEAMETLQERLFEIAERDLKIAQGTDKPAD
jgi:hypothetical protein